MNDLDSVKFPSGRTVRQIKQDAKKLKQARGLRHMEALDILTKKNGVQLPWNKALRMLFQQQNIKDEEPVTEVNPHCKLLILGLNKLIAENVVSLDLETYPAVKKTKGRYGEPNGHLFTKIAGEPSVVLWKDGGHGEIMLSVWWKYNRLKQLEATHSFEEYTLLTPFSEKNIWRKFVGVIACCWVERDRGKYIYGVEKAYTRKGELDNLKKILDPIPQGFDVEESGNG